MRKSRRGRKLFFAISVPLAFLVAFALVVFVYYQFHRPPQVDVTTTGFTPQTIEIPEGESLQFVNRSTTLAQVLCVGSDRRCARVVLTQLQSPPPRGLQSPGLRIAPGQARNIVFDTAGTYMITSTVLPNFNLTVTVDESA
jgi:plastocyanin